MEYITANGVEYATKSVTTKTDGIGFTLEGDVSEISSAFKLVTELTVSGEDKVVYGVYGNLSFSSAMVDSEGLITVFMSIKSDIEVRLDTLEQTQEIQDGAIVELAEILGGM